MHEWTLPEPSRAPHFDEPGFGAIFKLIFEQAFKTGKVTVPIALLAAIPTGVLGSIFSKLQPRLQTGNIHLAGMAVAMLLIVGVTVLAYLLLFPLASAGIAWAAARSTMTGTCPPIEDVFRRIGEQGPSAIGAVLLLNLLMFAPFVVFVFFAIVGFIAHAYGLIFLGLLIAASGMVAARIVIGTRGALVPAVVMQERVGGFAALRRSSELVAARFGRIFWLLFVTALVAGLMAALFSPSGADVTFTGGGPKVVETHTSIILIAAGQIFGGIVTTVAAGVKRGVIYAVRVQATTSPETPEDPGPPAGELPGGL